MTRPSQRVRILGLLVALPLLAAGAWVGWHKLGPHVAPASQPALVALTPDTLEVLRRAFNEAKGKRRIVALLSPT